MNEIASVLLSPLQGLLTTFQSERHHKEKQQDEALIAIQKALIATRQYIELSDGVKCADREKEYEISQLWAEASVKSRHASEDLAMRLNDKSLYWSDNIEWSSQEVMDKGITLEEMQLQVESMLKKA